MPRSLSLASVGLITALAVGVLIAAGVPAGMTLGAAGLVGTLAVLRLLVDLGARISPRAAADAGRQLAGVQNEIGKLQAQVEQLSKEQALHYRLTEALIDIHAVVRPRAPLPAMRDWTISPDFGRTLIQLILERKPRLVLELGSGTSTLLSAYALQLSGSGVVLSLESYPECAELSTRALRTYGLEAIATVVHTPLVELHCGAGRWNWYDLTRVPSHGAVDLVVDGPPGFSQKMARFPALPLLFDRLAEDAVVLLDDAARPDERAAVDLWLAQFPCVTREWIDSEKGTVVLRRTVARGGALDEAPAAPSSRDERPLALVGERS